MPHHLHDNARHRLLHFYGLSPDKADLLSGSEELTQYFEETAQHHICHTAAANWILGPLKTLMNKTHSSIYALNLKPAQLAEIISLIANKKINYGTARDKLFPIIRRQHSDLSAESVARAHRLLIDNEMQSRLPSMIDAILQEFPLKVEQYQQGKRSIKNFIMGQLITKANEKIDYVVASELVIQKLNSFIL